MIGDRLRRDAGIFLGAFFSHTMPGKAGDQAREVVFQQEADETKKSEQEDGREREPDEIGTAWRSEAGDVPS